MSAMWINVQTAQPVRSIKKREKRRILIKNFFNEFKKFISRGNVIDLAVGVIIGSAFTAFVVFCMVKAINIVQDKMTKKPEK